MTCISGEGCRRTRRTCIVIQDADKQRVARRGVNGTFRYPHSFHRRVSRWAIVHRTIAGVWIHVPLPRWRWRPRTPVAFHDPCTICKSNVRRGSRRASLGWGRVQAESAFSVSLMFFCVALNELHGHVWGGGETCARPLVAMSACTASTIATK